MPPEAANKAHFQEAYESKPPWDIGKPQKVFVHAADQITGSILDASVIKPGGKLFLCCFSDKEPPGQGPRRVSQHELHDAFAQGWQIESIREARFETRTDLDGMPFSEGGPFAWFCVIQQSDAPRRQRKGGLAPT